MYRRVIVGTLIISMTLGMTGCSCVSSLFGKEQLAMHEVPTVQTTEKPSEMRPQITTQIVAESNNETTKQPSTPQTTTTKPQPNKEEQTTTAPTKPNKQGNIKYKYYVFTSEISNPIPSSTQIINTKEQWQAFGSILGQYQGNGSGFNGESMLNDYFYVVIPAKNIKSSWAYTVESAKNDGTLTITTLCEKKNDANATDKSAIIIVAISRNDMPNIPSVDKIKIKNSSYTIK